MFGMKNNDKGNSVDFRCRVLGLGFHEALRELLETPNAEYYYALGVRLVLEKKAELPKKADNTALFRYLSKHFT
jgi:hypothetical protein